MRRKTQTIPKEEIAVNEIKVFVRGMNCNHCKMSVENNLKGLEGVETVNADVEHEIVTLTGENVDLGKVKETVEGIGYTYDGKATERPDLR